MEDLKTSDCNSGNIFTSHTQAYTLGVKSDRKNLATLYILIYSEDQCILQEFTHAFLSSK